MSIFLSDTKRADIRLIAADLDGTLLNEQKQIGERTLKALRKAAEKGILFVPSTGRILSAIPEQIMKLPSVEYAILVNGGCLWDCKRQCAVYREEIPKDRAVKLAKTMKAYGTMYDGYIDGCGYMVQSYYDQIDIYCPKALRAMIRETRRPVKSLENVISMLGGVQKMQMFFVDMELRERAWETIEEMYPDMTVTTSVYNNLEVNAKNATKGRALEKLCSHLNIKLSQVLAFGDGCNDITMLKAAGTGVAMENGAEELKREADAVTAANDKEGVADFLEKYVL